MIRCRYMAVRNFLKCVVGRSVGRSSVLNYERSARGVKKCITKLFVKINVINQYCELPHASAVQLRVNSSKLGSLLFSSSFYLKSLTLSLSLRNQSLITTVMYTAWNVQCIISILSILFCQYGSTIQKYTKYKKYKNTSYTQTKNPNASHGNQ